MTLDALKAAREALLTAIAACESAGFVAPALGGCLANLDKRIVSEERRAVPIAIGDKVSVRSYGAPRWETVTRVTRTTVYAKFIAAERAYRLADGQSNAGMYIDPDDLHRIHRDLVTRPKRERGGAK